MREPERKCTLTDEELVESVITKVSKLCKEYQLPMSIPAKPNEDVDLLIAELAHRFKLTLTPTKPNVGSNITQYPKDAVTSVLQSIGFGLDDGGFIQSTRTKEYGKDVVGRCVHINDFAGVYALPSGKLVFVNAPPTITSSFFVDNIAIDL